MYACSTQAPNAEALLQMLPQILCSMSLSIAFVLGLRPLDGLLGCRATRVASLWAPSLSQMLSATQSMSQMLSATQSHRWQVAQEPNSIHIYYSHVYIYILVYI